jgi:hypothetical protein
MDANTDGKLVGRKGKARAPITGDVVGAWKTDIIDNRDPDAEYQFFHEDQVRDKLRSSFVVLKDFRTGEVERHTISPWTIVHRDTGAEEAAGWRPDEGKPLDTVLRHGPMVCLKIDRKSWDLLQRAAGQRADAYDVLSKRGTSRDFNQGGDEHAAGGDKPYVRVTEQPLKRI